MTDEATVCAAAFFRSIGKDVTTPEEFVMSTSLEMKWMSPSDSKLLLKMLLREGILVQKGDFIRPSADIQSLDVPMAYKPSPELVDLIHSKPKEAPKPEPSQKADEPVDAFHRLIEVAKENGIQAKDFVPECTRIQKRLGIDVGACGLIVLRDKGVDISGLIQPVYDNVRSQ